MRYIQKHGFWKYVLAGHIVALSVAATAQAAVNDTIVAKVGPWTVHRTQDTMTDAVSCTALFKDSFNVQLTNSSIGIALRGRGGVASYIYRLDNQPAVGPVLPTKIEKQIGAVSIDGDRYNQIKAAQRFRIQVFTVLSTVVEEDIDLADMPALQSKFESSDCKLTPSP